MSRNSGKQAGVMIVRPLPDRTAIARCQRAFSLYELLFVVIIIGLLATVMMPAEEPSEGIKIDLAAAEIADALRYARTESLRLGVPHGVTVDTKRRHVSVFRMDMQATPATAVYDVYHPIDKKLYDRQLGALPFDFSGRLAMSTSYRGGCNTQNIVVFDTNGTPWCSDPNDVLVIYHGVELLLGNHRKGVVVSGINGRVTIQ